MFLLASLVIVTHRMALSARLVLITPLLSLVAELVVAGSGSVVCFLRPGSLSSPSSDVLTCKMTDTGNISHLYCSYYCTSILNSKKALKNLLNPHQ